MVEQCLSMRLPGCYYVCTYLGYWIMLYSIQPCSIQYNKFPQWLFAVACHRQGVCAAGMHPFSPPAKHQGRTVRAGRVKYIGSSRTSRGGYGGVKQPLSASPPKRGIRDLTFLRTKTRLQRVREGHYPPRLKTLCASYATRSARRATSTRLSGSHGPLRGSWPFQSTTSSQKKKSRRTKMPA